MSEPDKLSFRHNPSTLGRLVGGFWERRPKSNWSLRNIESLRRLVRRSNQRQPRDGTLLYVRYPKDVVKLKDSPLDSTDVAIMVERDSSIPDTEAAVLRVPNVEDAVGMIMAAARAEYRGRLIAVTGSMGKSTVQAMISQVLAEHHTVYAPRSDMNSIRRTRSRMLELADEDYAVFEVVRAALPGAEDVLQPDIAIVTAIAEAHLEAFGSLESTARRKAQLFRGLGSGGVAIVNIDAPHSDILLEAASNWGESTITYGVSHSASLRLLDYNRRDGLVKAGVDGGELSYRLNVTGEHNALNSLAVVAVLKALGLEYAQYLSGFEKIRPLKGRGAVADVSLSGHRVTLVDQSFNANPASVRAALSDFGNQYMGRPKFLILGDMRELGDGAESLHASLVSDIIGCDPDRVYLVGPLMDSVWSKLPENIRGAHVMDPSQLLRLVPYELTDEAAVMVKASQATGLGVLVESWSSEEVTTDPALNSSVEIESERESESLRKRRDGARQSSGRFLGDRWRLVGRWLNRGEKR